MSEQVDEREHAFGPQATEFDECLNELRAHNLFNLDEDQATKKIEFRSKNMGRNAEKRILC